ncbi:MAG: phage gp6-like head-tail connector protein [Gemmatimonadetes bacterium]|nr:phage gp6-like head-tail connector protein [Gemmatimonadota bacterium]
MVEVTDAEARAYLGLPDEPDPFPALAGMIAASREAVHNYAPDAPEDTAKLCVLKLVSFHFANRHGVDSGDGPRPGDPMRVTGCIGLLSPYRVRRAVS